MPVTASGVLSKYNLELTFIAERHTVLCTGYFELYDRYVVCWLIHVTGCTHRQFTRTT